MNDSLARTSKFLSYVLRHNPSSINLDLDPGGWADVDTLVENARAGGQSLSRARIRHLITERGKTRFALSADGTKIRANYGHSIDVNLDLEPVQPPKPLYHGTTQDALAAIRTEGLQPQSRQYVHLSSSREAATAVGRRHGTPVVLTIEAPVLHEAGYSLYQSTDSVWLTHQVPPSFIQFP